MGEKQKKTVVHEFWSLKGSPERAKELWGLLMSHVPASWRDSCANGQGPGSIPKSIHGNTFKSVPCARWTHTFRCMRWFLFNRSWPQAREVLKWRGFSTFVSRALGQYVARPWHIGIRISKVLWEFVRMQWGERKTNLKISDVFSTVTALSSCSFEIVRVRLGWSQRLQWWKTPDIISVKDLRILAPH